MFFWFQTYEFGTSIHGSTPEQVMEPFNQTAPTVSAKVQRDYIRCFERNRAKFGLKLGRPELTPEEVVAHLIVSREDYAARTWRFYKASTIYYLETYHPELSLAVDELRLQSSAGLRSGGANTSARKRKDVPSAQWDELRHAIRQRIADGYKHAGRLLAVLEATLIVGLRPNEWSFSEISTDQATGRQVLRVRNSKFSNGRANGEYREMYVDELMPEQLRHITDALAMCRCETEQEAEKLQLALKHELEAARALSVVGQRKPKSSLTLYSFRHQFVADCKRSFDDPVLTAALCGHVSTKTAHRHYGRRTQGRSSVRVYPTEASVQAVQSRHLETYRDFVAKRGPRNSPSLGHD